MKFPVGHALSFPYHNATVSFSVQGDPAEELCISCEHTLFSQRFSGGTKCFDPFISAPFLPNETDENYEYFLLMKMTILNAFARL